MAIKRQETVQRLSRLRAVCERIGYELMPGPLYKCIHCVYKKTRCYENKNTFYENNEKKTFVSVDKNTVS